MKKRDWKNKEKVKIWLKSSYQKQIKNAKDMIAMEKDILKKTTFKYAKEESKKSIRHNQRRIRNMKKQLDEL